MSKEYYSKEIERIKSVLADYYDTDFDSDEEDFLVNKSNKQLIEKLIINLKNDDELDVSNKNFFIKEALQLLAKNTGCVEDEEISDEILEKLLVKHIISRSLKTIFQHKACTDKLYADSFYKVQKNSHSSFEVICCCS